MPDWKLKILYDGECPFCRREMNWLRRRDRRGALEFENIAEPDFNAARYGLTQSEVMGVIHGIYPDGRVVKRLAVFREAYRAVGLGWLLVPTDWPLLRGLCNAAYEWFARNRLRLGGRCESGSCKAGSKPLV
jgi:predicted DCC family thiol-disulfide oxidoreductase YuxK